MFLCRIYVFRCMCVSIRRKPFLCVRLSARCQPYAGSYPLWGYERNGSCPVLNAEMRCCKIKAVMAAGFHLFPFRTEKLSPPAPMVLRKWESRRPPTFQGSLRRRVSNSLFSFAEVLFNFTLQPVVFHLVCPRQVFRPLSNANILIYRLSPQRARPLRIFLFFEEEFLVCPDSGMCTLL